MLHRNPSLMPRFTFPRRLICLLACLAAGIAVASAQDQPGAKASLTARKIYVGETTQLALELTNITNVSAPPEIEVNGLQIQFLSSSNSRNIRMGSGGSWSTTTLSLHYLVQGNTPGRFIIPPIQVTSGGKTFKTDTLDLVVLEADASGDQPDLSRDVVMHLDIPETELFVGEVVPVRITLYVLNQRSIQGMAPPQIENDQLAIQRFDLNGRRGLIESKGRYFSTISVDSALFPVKSGIMSVGPASAESVFIDPAGGRQRVSPFGPYTRRLLSSNLVELNVKPLPEAGRPVDFGGAVGQFDMSVRASPMKLNAGDPISIDLEITGTGNFESLEFPEITAPDGWRFYPEREVAKVVSDGVTGGRLAFSRVIVPLKEHTEIPPFELSFFDPEQEKYVTLKSLAIPIEVAPDSGLPAEAREPADTGSSAPGPENSFAGAPPQPKPEPEFEDILHIKITVPSFRSGATPVLQSTWFWLAQIPPALIAGSMIGLVLVRRGRARLARSLRETKAASSAEIRASLSSGNLSRTDFYRGILDFFDQWQREHGSDSADASDDSQKLRETAHRTVYGHAVDPGEASSTVPPEERRAALTVLQHFAHS
jgi:hypothetical protein